MTVPKGTTMTSSVEGIGTKTYQKLNHPKEPHQNGKKLTSSIGETNTTHRVNGSPKTPSITNNPGSAESMKHTAIITAKSANSISTRSDTGRSPRSTTNVTVYQR